MRRIIFFIYKVEHERFHLNFEKPIYNVFLKKKQKKARIFGEWLPFPAGSQSQVPSCRAASSRIDVRDQAWLCELIDNKFLLGILRSRYQQAQLIGRQSIRSKTGWPLDFWWQSGWVNWEKCVHAGCTNSTPDFPFRNDEELVQFHLQLSLATNTALWYLPLYIK